jgi:hypothetical protein
MDRTVPRDGLMSWNSMSVTWQTIVRRWSGGRTVQCASWHKQLWEGGQADAQCSAQVGINVLTHLISSAADSLRRITAGVWTFQENLRYVHHSHSTVTLRKFVTHYISDSCGGRTYTALWPLTLQQNHISRYDKITNLTKHISSARWTSTESTKKFLYAVTLGCSDSASRRPVITKILPCLHLTVSILKLHVGALLQVIWTASNSPQIDKKKRSLNRGWGKEAAV